jgi:putative addiction module component (TIGR02574 family)
MMSVTLAEIEEQARQLSAEDRARLADAMLESLQDNMPADVAAAWDQEIERRVDEFERGETQTFSSEDVFAEARRMTR